MSEKTVQMNEEVSKGQIKELVRGSAKKRSRIRGVCGREIGAGGAEALAVLCAVAARDPAERHLHAEPFGRERHRGTMLVPRGTLKLQEGDTVILYTKEKKRELAQRDPAGHSDEIHEKQTGRIGSRARRFGE